MAEPITLEDATADGRFEPMRHPLQRSAGELLQSHGFNLADMTMTEAAEAWTYLEPRCVTWCTTVGISW